jgi:pyruvate,orthophosphate dikinase
VVLLDGNRPREILGNKGHGIDVGANAPRDEQPAVYDELMDAARRLERLESDAQETEFTVEDGTLWLLQIRSAERSTQAAVRLALQLRHEFLIDDTETLLLPSLQPETRLAAPLLANGLSAYPGAASRRAYTRSEDVSGMLTALRLERPAAL